MRWKRLTLFCSPSDSMNLGKRGNTSPAPTRIKWTWSGKKCRARMASSAPRSMLIPFPCKTMQNLAWAAAGNREGLAWIETRLGTFRKTIKGKPCASFSFWAMDALTVNLPAVLGTKKASSFFQIHFFNGWLSNSGTSVNHSWLSYTNAAPCIFAANQAGNKVSKSLA